MQRQFAIVQLFWALVACLIYIPLFCRVSELFEIIVDFPDSEPAIQDLKLCLKKVPYKEQLVSCLDDKYA